MLNEYKRFVSAHFLNIRWVGEKYLCYILYNEFVDEVNKKIIIDYNKLKENVAYYNKNFYNIKELKTEKPMATKVDNILKHFIRVPIRSYRVSDWDIVINHIQPKDWDNLPDSARTLKDIENIKCREQVAQEKQYKQKVQSIKQKEYGYGIYGLYADDELIYIGETGRDFEIRKQEHFDNIKNGNKLRVYNILREEQDKGKIITFKPIIDLSKPNIENKKTFTIKEIQCMEYALITVRQPRGNVEGTFKPYRF